jgi:hypothetical protein
MRALSTLSDRGAAAATGRFAGRAAALYKQPVQNSFIGVLLPAAHLPSAVHNLAVVINGVE